MKSNAPSESDVSNAIDTLRRDYWADVRGYAEDIEARILEGELDSDTVYDAIHETCDAAQRVIYTQLAQLTVAVADGNAFEEYQDEYGEPCPSFEVGAFFVLNRDVTELVNASDVYAALEDGTLAELKAERAGEEKASQA